MEIIEKNGQVILAGCKDFEPRHIFECGQCFRFDKEADGSYTMVAKNKVVNVSKSNDDVILKNTDLAEYDDFWANYFDMGTDYGKIKRSLGSMDDYLKVACEFAPGIRILRQDFEEMAISFIISARNSIPAIKKCVNFLSEHLGEKIATINGKTYYAFPTMKSLANADLELLRESKAAFRAPYIRASAQKILDENMSYRDFENMDLGQTVEKLRTLPGIGPKVADCVALFSLNKMSAFPVDVWVKRVMEEFYLNGETLSLKKMRTFALDYFGPLSGYAQQYLFYYAREKGLGKKKP